MEKFFQYAVGLTSDRLSEKPIFVVPDMHVPHRHGCLTAWLYLILIAGVVGVGGLAFASQISHRPGYHPPSPVIVALVVGCLVVSMACAGGMFLLKRWGFYGYVAANAALSGLNFAAGIDLGHSLVPLIWVACLIGVMQIGGRYKAWNRLRW